MGKQRKSNVRQPSTDKPKRQVLEAQEVVLKDGKGKARARFRVGRNGDPSLQFLDSEGKARMESGLKGPEGVPWFVINDQEGRTRLKVALDKQGRPAVTVRGDNGKEAVVLGAMADHSLGLSFTDARGTTRMRVGLDFGGDPALIVCDPQGFFVGGLAVAADGKASLFLHNREDLAGAGLSSERLTLLDGEGRVATFSPLGEEKGTIDRRARGRPKKGGTAAVENGSGTGPEREAPQRPA